MSPHLRPLREQVIIITGASSGIGLATARMAAKAGATMIGAARDEEALKDVVQEIRDDGGQASHVVCDVGRRPRRRDRSR